MKQYKPLVIILGLVFLQACDVSRLSNEDINNPENLNVRILMTDTDQKKPLNSVVVYLTDGKQKQIINNDIKVLLNDIELELYIKSEIYYQKIAFYKADKFVRNDTYYFEIILPNGSRHPLAYIKPLKRNDNARFLIPKTISRTEDFNLKWENINFPATTEIWKSVHNKENPHKYSGGRYAASTLHDTIRTKNGSYTVPKSFYEDPETIADFLHIRISSVAHGLINPKLIQGSDIAYTFFEEETVEIDKKK